MRVAIIGYGKMGRAIQQILEARGHEIALIIDADNAADLCADRMKGVDVAIEFSTPDAAFENIKKCLTIGIPVVCGTTAWTVHMPEAEALCKERDGAFFYASNYSIGVNVAFELNRRAAEIMDRFGDYDASIEETHHTAKKDAPSGTAITLADDLVARVARKSKWVEGFATEAAELGVASVRRSVAPGTHVVTWESDVDRLTLTHEIKSRSGLAAGAVAAAEFLAGKRGVFSMKDLLGF